MGGTGTVFPVAGSQVGLALEATRGTLESEPAYMFPVMEPKYEPHQSYIPVQTLQGIAVKTIDEVLGMRYDGHGWSAPVYLDSFMLLLIGIFGAEDTVTTAPTSTTLSAAATVGATTITTAAALAAGDWIQIGTYPTMETHQVKSVAEDVSTLYEPIIFPQASDSAVTGLTLHQTSVLNTDQMQPPSLSLWDNDNEEWRTMSACQLMELSIKGNATGLVEYTVSLMGNPATENASAPSTSYTTVQTPAPWTFYCLVGGDVAPVEEWEITWNRDTKEVPALEGTQEYFAYFADMMNVTAKVTFEEQSGSPYIADNLEGTRQSFDMTVFDMLSGFAFNYHSTTSVFTTSSLTRGNSEWVKVPVDVQPLPVADDATENGGGQSPGLVSIANSVTSSYGG